MKEAQPFFTRSWGCTRRTVDIASLTRDVLCKCKSPRPARAELAKQAFADVHVCQRAASGFTQQENVSRRLIFVGFGAAKATTMMMHLSWLNRARGSGWC